MGSRGGYGSRRYVCVSGDGFGGWVKAATSKFGYCEFFGLHLIFVFEFSVFLSSSFVFMKCLFFPIFNSILFLVKIVKFKC